MTPPPCQHCGSLNQHHAPHCPNRTTTSIADPTWRCSSCGCIAVDTRGAHARGCVYGISPAHETALAALHRGRR